MPLKSSQPFTGNPGAGVQIILDTYTTVEDKRSPPHTTDNSGRAPHGGYETEWVNVGIRGTASRS